MHLIGLDTGAERKAGFFGSLELEPRFDPGPDEILLSEFSASLLDAKPGDTVEAMFSLTERRPLRVKVLLNLERSSMESVTGFAPETGDNMELAVLVKSPGQAKDVAAAIHKLLPEAGINTWQGLLGFIRDLIDMTSAASMLTVAFVALILSFGIASMTFVSVAQRMREFGIYKTVGLAPWRISLLVVAETVVLVASAGLIGMLLGLAAIYITTTAGGINLTPLFKYSAVAGGTWQVLPRVTVTAVLLPFGATLLSAFIASFFPARRAGRISVVEAMRSL